MARANICTAPLVASYSTSFGVPRTAEIDEVHTIDPLPAASIIGRTARVIRYMDFTFTSNRKSQSSSLVSRKGLMTMVPAWLNSTFTSPRLLRTVATAAFT